jgi:outer membrane protein TolC
LASDERIPGNHRDGGVKEEVGQATEGSQVVQLAFDSSERDSRQLSSANKVFATAKVLIVLAVTVLSITGCQSGNPFARHPIGSSVEFSERDTIAPASSHGLLSAGTHHATKQLTEHGKLNVGKQVDSRTALATASPATKTQIRLVGLQEDGDDSKERLIPTDDNAESGKSEDLAGGDDKADGSDAEADALLYEDEDPPTKQTNLNQSNFGLATNSISLEQILNSVAQCYPEIEIAIGEIETANGKVLSSWGEFDRVVSGHSISQPLGFYQTYRNGVGINQPLYGGGAVYGTYRIGDGNFEPWFGERETNEGGELKAGFSLPLLKDRSIDERRANLLASDAKRDQVQSNVDSRLLQFQRFATQAYWDWLASGQAAQIQQRLLELAQARVSAIKTRVEKGDLAEIAQIDNDRLIAKRKNDLIKARRSLEKAAIKLSLFWRDANCSPIIATSNQLPQTFPSSIQVAAQQLASDIQNAFAVRPELLELQAKRREACIDRQYGENLTLPKLDVKGFAGQDLGGETSSKGDKTPFELQLGVFYEVPLERRKGRGKIQSANGKLTQIDAKIRLVGDKIRAELQDAASAVNAAFDQIQQSRENLRLTRKSLELGRISFEEGDIDLITLNIYEAAVADAELQLLDAQYKYFFYRAIYETAKTGTAFTQ